MPETNMKETKIIGSLLPSHEDIMPILKEIREKYQIPEISSIDNEMKILLRHELEFDWVAIHAEILEKVREIPELWTEKSKKAYDAITKMESKGVEDPELEKTSQEFRDNLQLFIDLIVKQYKPIVKEMDAFFHAIADHCIEYLITGEAREVPSNWFSNTEVVEPFGEKVVVLQASGAADPDEAAEMFKKKFRQTFGKKKYKFTETHVKTADFLRMRWEGKSYLYILEEWELREPDEFERTSSRHPTSLRNKNDRVRQRLHRMQRDLKKVLM